MRHIMTIKRRVSTPCITTFLSPPSISVDPTRTPPFSATYNSPPNAHPCARHSHPQPRAGISRTICVRRRDHGRSKGRHIQRSGPSTRRSPTGRPLMPTLHRRRAKPTGTSKASQDPAPLEYRTRSPTFLQVPHIVHKPWIAEWQSQELTSRHKIGPLHRKELARPQRQCRITMHSNVSRKKVCCTRREIIQFDSGASTQTGREPMPRHRYTTGSLKE
ncbi:hypothetical protein C8Q78DRAFT_581305 [Trametes maxima]|nr:hypothetical protein C8Q78DRAFT_581305 [Trametes maxima]